MPILPFDHFFGDCATGVAVVTASTEAICVLVVASIPLSPEHLVQPPNLSVLSGKNVLTTGGASGLSAVIAQILQKVVPKKDRHTLGSFLDRVCCK